VRCFGFGFANNPFLSPKTRPNSTESSFVSFIIKTPPQDRSHDVRGTLPRISRLPQPSLQTPKLTRAQYPKSPRPIRHLAPRPRGLHARGAACSGRAGGVLAVVVLSSSSLPIGTSIHTCTQPHSRIPQLDSNPAVIPPSLRSDDDARMVESLPSTARPNVPSPPTRPACGKIGRHEAPEVERRHPVATAQGFEPVSLSLSVNEPYATYLRIPCVHTSL